MLFRAGLPTGASAQELPGDLVERHTLKGPRGMGWVRALSISNKPLR